MKSYPSKFFSRNWIEKTSASPDTSAINPLKFIRSFFNYITECFRIHQNPNPKLQLRVADKIKGILKIELYMGYGQLYALM